LLLQSLGTKHFCDAAHAGQVPPPQSTSVSVPSWTLSVHDALWQVPPTQLLSLQSVGITQRFPTAHAAQAPPPQSTSVSVPSTTALAHPGSGGPESIPGVVASVPASERWVGGGRFCVDGEPPESSSSDPVAHAGVIAPRTRTKLSHRIGRAV
jgi:hypothetical protein